MNNIDWNLLNMVQKVTITPDIARLFISKNRCNRNISKHTIYKYSSEMVKNSWQENSPNVISFSSDGYLLDGQHRLNAIIESGKTYDWFVYIHNKDFENIKPMDLMVDVGKKRTVSDITDINNRVIAPIYRLLHLCKNHSNPAVSVNDVFNFYNLFIKEDDNIISLLKRKKQNIWSSSHFKAVALAYYVSNQENREYVTDLVNNMLEEDFENNPILLKYLFRVSKATINPSILTKIAVNLFNKDNANHKILKMYEKPLAPLLRDLLMQAGLEQGFWR